MNYTDNILRVYDRATLIDLHAGATWYPNAQVAAREIGAGDILKGAGIIAAMSPQKEWERNLKVARRAAAGEHVTEVTGDTWRKVQRIMAGERPTDVLGGLKVRSFYDNIVNPYGDSVTIDRHAHDVAMGDKYGNDTRKIGVRVYRELSEAYRRAAQLRGVAPAEMQATVWGIWIKDYQWKRVA